jgi:hypothetical protein
MRRTRSAARRLRCGLIGLALATLLLPTSAVAQNVTGTILGTVRDATAAGVPDAQVTLTQNSTGLARVLASDSSGDYAAPLLGTGVYTVMAQAPGFKQASVTGVQLSVAQTVRVDLRLEIGELTESVQVESANPLVRRSSSDVSATLGMTEIQTLPLVTRNFVQLTRTIPGVARGVAGENIDGAGSVGWRNSASFTANGQRPRDNNFLLDGVDNNETWLNTVAIFPSVDALEEFKVQTSIYAAEFGRSTGGVVSLQTRSGANTLRGSGFGFLRDDRFDANDWFNNRAGRPRPDFGQHQFGGTFGGPLVKGRTFFFTDYQGTRIKQDLTLVSTVPSEAMRRGDFSELNRVIYDATTGLPFPGNVVPPERVDETARRVIDELYPLPNATGRRAATGQTIDNYVINPTLRRHEDQFDVRIDHALTAANRPFARYSAQYAEREIPPSLPRGDGGVGAGFGLPGTYDIEARSLAVNDTHVFARGWLNEFRLGWSAIDVGFAPFGFGQNTAEQLGIPGINLDERTSGMVNIGLGLDMRGLGSGGGPLRLDMTALQFTDSVTYVRGRHSVKSGASLVLRQRIVDTSGQIGQFGFNSNVTSSCAGRQGVCTPASSSGFAFADLVLGYPSLFNRGLLEAPYTERRPEWGAYLQDDVRVSGGLTLNLGVRWDLFVPYVEDDDRQSNFDTATGQFVVASDDAVVAGVAVGRHLQTYSTTNFAPRVGFAYDLNGEGRTVVRGGFGMFWNSPFTGTSGSKGQNPPFLLSQTLTNPSPFVPTLSLSTGLIPATPLTGGTSRSSFDPNFRDGYAQQWNLGVQHQLGRDAMVDIGYVGSRGRQLVVLVDVNQAPATPGVTNANVNRPFFRVNPTLASVVQSTPKGTLDYHAVQARLVRRFSGGLSFQTSYTFGKAIDLDSETDGLSRFPNSYDLGYNRGPANYDQRHVLTSNWIYILPFARDSRLGGWQISGILLARSGYPFTVFQSSNPLSTVTAGSPYRPDRIGSGRVENPTVDRWFAVEDFARPTEPTATFGSSGRNILRGPGQFTIDASVGKLTRVGRVETELRVEAFNVLNEPVFANPVSTIGSSSTGTISSLLPFTPMRQLQFVLKARF